MLLNIFSYAYLLSVYLWRVFCSALLPISQTGCLFSYVGFKNSLQNLGNSLLPDTPFANIFSMFVFFLNKIIVYNLVLSLDLGARWLDGTSGC